MGQIFGNPAQAANSNNTIQNNVIKRVQNGIYSNGFATSPYDIGWQVRNNTFGSSVLADKLGFRGMIFINASTYVIDNNTITGINSSQPPHLPCGYPIGNWKPEWNISNNKISNIKHNNTTGWGSNVSGLMHQPLHQILMYLTTW